MNFFQELSGSFTSEFNFSSRCRERLLQGIGNYKSNRPLQLQLALQLDSLAVVWALALLAGQEDRASQVLGLLVNLSQVLNLVVKMIGTAKYS